MMISESRPCSMSNLVYSLSNRDVDDIIVRQKSVKESYAAHKAQVNENYESLADYLKVKIFNAEEIVSTEGKIKTDQNLPPMTKLTLNEFPYFFESGMEHYVFWSTRKIDLEKLKVEMIERFPLHHLVIWINPMKLRSVPEIEHAHIVTKKLKESAILFCQDFNGE